MTREARNRQIQEQLRQQQMYAPQYPVYPGVPMHMGGMHMGGMPPMYPTGRGNRNFAYPIQRGPRGPAPYGPGGVPYQRPPRMVSPILCVCMWCVFTRPVTTRSIDS
jgi:hypothetical protein